MELKYSLWNQTGHSLEQAEKLCLLHGMGGTGALWRPVAAALENEFAVLAPDQRGHGGSQIPSVAGSRTKTLYTPLAYGEDLVDTLGSLPFHPTWVVGHSMGVRSACALAFLKPDWVKGLVLVDLGFYGEAGGGLGSGLSRFLKVLPTHFASREAAREFMRQNCPDPAIGQYLMAVSVPTPESGRTFPFDHAALIETIEAARTASVREWVKDLSARGKPVLVLRGAESLVWSHEEFEEEKATFAPFPSVKFQEVAGTGHGLPFEKRAEFVEILRRFFSGASES